MTVASGTADSGSPRRGPSQPQRTALAWSRTALAAATLAGAAVKTAANHTDAGTIACAIATALSAAGIFVCGQLRARYEVGARPPGRAVFLTGVACAALSAIAALVLVALPQS